MSDLEPEVQEALLAALFESPAGARCQEPGCDRPEGHDGWHLAALPLAPDHTDETPADREAEWLARELYERDRGDG